MMSDRQTALEATRAIPGLAVVTRLIVRVRPEKVNTFFA